MGKRYMVNVYADDFLEKVVARVTYNQDLDYWDGRNWSNGGLGQHRGLAKLKDGRFVIIYGTDWEGQRDYGLVVTDDEALQAVLKSGNVELLKTKKCKPLKELYDRFMVAEEE